MKTSLPPPAWPDTDDLREQVAEVLAAAMRSGADEAEAYLEAVVGLSLEICRRTPMGIRSRRTCGIGLRLLRGGRMGYAFTSSPLNARGQVELVRAASESSAFSAPDGCNALAARAGGSYAELPLDEPGFSSYSGEAKFDLLGRAVAALQRSPSASTRLAAAAYTDHARW